VAYRVGKKEDITAGLVRLILGDVGDALADLTGIGPVEKRIHRVRQRLKRVRTLLRVLEPAFGERVVALRRQVAATARLLSHARDADVAAASARDLAATASEDVGFERVAEALDREAAATHQNNTPVGEVKRQLAATRDEIAALGTDFDGAALLDAALKRSYRRGRRAMRRARTSLATPDLHRWRKEAKHFWHLTRLARRRLPPRARRLARRLDRMSELLGRDHDHALLAERLALSRSGNTSLMRQLALVAEQRRQLEREAFALGGAVYRRKPRAFARRIRLR